MSRDRFGDPGLWVLCGWSRRAVMFDIGESPWLSSRQLARVTHLFLSHLHLDHFAGFERLLRRCLHRAEQLRVFGPAGTGERVARRLGAYVWNLLGDSPFVIEVTEVAEDRLAVRRFAARRGFRAEDPREAPWAGGELCREWDFAVEGLLVDHGIPCLALLLREPAGLGIDREALGRHGLLPGGWLDELRRLLWNGAPRGALLSVPTRSGVQRLSLEWLARRLVIERPPYRIGYVVDTRGSEENLDRLARFLRGCNLLLCEAAFPHRDADRAWRRGHLTARQAGLLARRAGVSRLEPIHLSPRYAGEEQALVAEAQAAFARDEAGEGRGGGREAESAAGQPRG
jgi:ribonuclease Z